MLLLSAHELIWTPSTNEPCVSWNHQWVTSSADHKSLHFPSQAAAETQSTCLCCLFLLTGKRFLTFSQQRAFGLYTFLPIQVSTASQGASSGVCELLTRISTDLSDVFSDTSEVTSHKAAVILAVEYATPWSTGQKNETMLKDPCRHAEAESCPRLQRKTCTDTQISLHT